MVFFEAPRRTRATLVALAEVFGPDRAAVVCRELTKTYEEVRRGSLAELAQWAEAEPRGEITMVVAGAPDRAQPRSPGDLREAVLALEVDGLARKEAIRQVAADSGVAKRAVYDAVHRPDPAQSATDD